MALHLTTMLGKYKLALITNEECLKCVYDLSGQTVVWTSHKQWEGTS